MPLSLIILVDLQSKVAAQELLIRDWRVAQAFLDERCPDEYVFLLGETRNYRVVICGDRATGNPTHYLGTSKADGYSILLPLNAFTETRFFARNGRYTYTLDLRSQTLTLGIPGRRPLVERFTAETP